MINYIGKSFSSLKMSGAAKRFIENELGVNEGKFKLYLEGALDGIKSPSSEAIPKMIDGKYRRVVGQTIHYDIVSGAGIALKLALVLHYDEVGVLWVDEIRF